MKRITTEIQNFGFDDYRVIEIDSREHQLYLLKDRLESKRTVDTHYYEITVYLNHNAQTEKLQGEYTFVYKPDTDLKAYLEQAKIVCALVKNRRYSLVDSTTPSEVKVMDPRLHDPLKTGQLLTETIHKHSKGTYIHLSSAELYLKKSVVTLATSTGVEVTKEKGLIELEASLLGKRGKREQELNFHIQRRSVDDLHLEKRLREFGEHTRNMLQVQVPKSGKATVAFPVADIFELLSPIIFHSSGRAKDKAISRFKLKEKVVEADSNTFTLKSSGLLPYGLYSDPFDDDGIPGQDHTIIDRGVFEKYWTTKRYADYLRIEPTGAFKNLVIEPTIEITFDDNDYYEIVQFSDLSPDPITGDFVAEIRLGYYVKNGKKTPIKGGSVSGNVFEALKSVYFTDQSIFEGDYLGPKILALKDLSISGG
ncbi:MAG: metallopeptidase TldD-related protein [bacterium]